MLGTVNMEVLSHPNPVLKQTALEVDPSGDTELRPLVQGMVRVMREAPGVGLAAPQIGVQKRVIVVEVEEDKIAALCNPCIVDSSEETEVDDEGCLSLPGISVPVERNASVTCEALTISGQAVRIDAYGLLARVLQHEIDHLDGLLIIDRAAPDERKAALRRYHDLLAG